MISVGDRQNYAPSLKSSQTHKVQCRILRARETVNRTQSASSQSLDQTIHVLASLFVMFAGFSTIAMTMSILSMTLQHHPLSCELCNTVQINCIIGAICVLFGQQSPGVTTEVRGASTNVNIFGFHLAIKNLNLVISYEINKRMFHIS